MLLAGFTGLIGRLRRGRDSGLGQTRRAFDGAPGVSQNRHTVSDTYGLRLKTATSANILFLHSSDDDNFARRLKTVVPLIFPKLPLNLLPGFRTRGLG